MNESKIKVLDSNFEKSFQFFLSQCCQKIDVNRVSVSLRHNEDVIIFALSTDEEEIYLDLGGHFPIEGSVYSHCLEEKKPLLNNILSDSYVENKYYIQSNFQSSVHFPLILDDHVIGTIDILSYKDNHYSATDMDEISGMLYTLVLLLINYNLQTIIKKSENILTYHEDTIEFLKDIPVEHNLPAEEVPEMEDYLGKLLNKVFKHIVIENSSNHIIYASNDLLRVLGYSMEEIFGKELVEYIIEEDQLRFEKIVSDGIDDTLQFRRKDDENYFFFIKAYIINDKDDNHILTVYHLTEQAKSIGRDILSHMEGLFSIVDTSYHIQYASPSLKLEFDEPIVGRTCYKAINKSYEKCIDCPVEAGKVSVEGLKNHVAFTRLKDGTRKMILFILLKLEDNTTVMLEIFKDTSIERFFHEESKETSSDEKQPTELESFIEQNINKIISPVSSLLDNINNLQNISINQLEDDIYYEKMHFLYETTKHLQTAIYKLNNSLHTHLPTITTTTDNKKKLDDMIPALRGKKILIIDPDDVTRASLYHFLSGLGYNIFQANDGLEGILQTKNHRPDFILTEVNLAKVNGFLLIQKISEHIAKKIPFAILSNIKNTQIIEKAFQLGIKGYMGKTPLKLKEIARLIYDVLLEMENEKQLASAQRSTQIESAKSQPIPPAKEDIKEEVNEEEPAIKKTKDKPKASQYLPTDKAIDMISELSETEHSPDDNGSSKAGIKSGKSVQLSDLGIDVQEMQGGTVMDFGESKGLTHSITVDEGILVFRLKGYLSPENLEPITKDFIKTIGETPSDKRKIILDLVSVLPKSINKKALDALFIFFTTAPEMSPERIKVYTTDSTTISEIKNHKVGKTFSIVNDAIDAFSQLQMQI